MSEERPIRIGALLDDKALARLDGAPGEDPSIESYSLSFWESLGGTDLSALVDTLSSRFRVAPTCLSLFGNPLAEDIKAERLLKDLTSLIDAAPGLGCGLVSTFAGRVPGASVPESLGRFREVFGPLCDRAAALGVSIAFENCRFGDGWKTGKWNIAIGPDAWELLFDSLPGAPIGLEWEPAHQLLALADPVAQLSHWLHRVLHIHAKDAHVDRGALALRGIVGTLKIGEERLAGDGDADWTKLFALLAESGWKGAVDVEIGATPGWSGDRSIQGIRRAIANLHRARSLSEKI
ncbi:MAG TPA: sugar phosphate isomerase/epimerase [Rectinemataceae bacterium]|nr:sugar phosphate isomerase/epimerase [Rectinemataceae bacterium]